MLAYEGHRLFFYPALEISTAKYPADLDVSPKLGIEQLRQNSGAIFKPASIQSSQVGLLDAGETLEVSWFQPRETTAIGSMDNHRIQKGAELTPYCLKMDNSLVVQAEITVEGALTLIPGVVMATAACFMLF